MNALVAPLIVSLRVRLLNALELASEHALLLDLFFLVLFGTLAALAYCFLLSAAQNVAWAMLKILFFATLGLTLTHVTLALYETSSAEHEALRNAAHSLAQSVKQALF